MWDQDSTKVPTVYRLCQQRGPVAEHALRGAERDWPLTLDDCQAMLIRLLPQLKVERTGYWDYWRWVTRTRAEMARIFESHRQRSRARQDWDATALLRLRVRLEFVALRLYCAPLLPGPVAVPLTSLNQFSRLTA